MLTKKKDAPSVLESLPSGGYKLSREHQEAWDAARILNSIGEPGALQVKAKLFHAYYTEAQAAADAAEIVQANKWLVPPQHARPSSTMLALLVLCAVGTLAASVVAVADRFVGLEDKGWLSSKTPAGAESRYPSLPAPSASDAPLLPVDPPDPREGRVERVDAKRTQLVRKRSAGHD